MAENDATLLRSFIADETVALAEERQGRFWPSNHHRITPLITKAAGLLAPGERTDFYLHLMRTSGSIPAVGDREMPLLIAAYRRMLPFLDLRGVIQMSRRHNVLYVFGFDDGGTLPSGATATAAELKRHLRLLAQISNYTSMPAQRDRKDKFAAFAGEAPRLLETLRHLRYRHDRRYDDDLYDVTTLSFWGMVFICLLNRDTRAGLIADMLEGRDHLPKYDEQMAILHGYVQSVLSDVQPDEERFGALARILADKEQARRNASESVMLAKALQLPFDEEENWSISIDIPLRGSPSSPSGASSTIRLQINPNPDWQWNLVMRLNPRGRFSESERGVTQNDIAIPPLGAGNLQNFPAWLKSLSTVKGLDFDIGAAEIRAGRKRAAVKLIAHWLTG